MGDEALDNSFLVAHWLCAGDASRLRSVSGVAANAWPIVMCGVTKRCAGTLTVFISLSRRALRRREPNPSFIDAGSCHNESPESPAQ